MKKSLLLVLFVLALCYSKAQVSVYLKLTPYPSSNITIADENPGTTHSGQIALTTLSNDEVQTLNIGSQSSGAGAGKVTFNPITFTKPISVNSPVLFNAMCSGSAFKFAEFSYYNSNDQVIFRITLSLAAVKTMARTAAACASGCPGIIENISFEYGTEVLSYYKTPGNTTSAVNLGWNRVTNVVWNDPTRFIQ